MKDGAFRWFFACGEKYFGELAAELQCGITPQTPAKKGQDYVVWRGKEGGRVLAEGWVKRREELGRVLRVWVEIEPGVVRVWQRKGALSGRKWGGKRKRE